MKVLINKILHIGILSTNEVKENKKIKLLNIFCFTWSVMIIFITIFDVIFDREIKESLVMHGVSYIVIGGIFFFQKKHFFILSRTLFISGITGITFIFSNYITPSNLIENFYFIYPLIGLILIEKKWINLTILLLCFLLYFIPNLYLKHYSQEIILPVLIFSVFIATYIILDYSNTLNKKHEKELFLNKRKLKQAYLELEKQKKSELACLQLKALKAQMNPHFLFNTINSIQSLILTGNKENAYIYLTKLSLLMRESINTSENIFVDFDVELSMIKKYLELEKLRFRENFSYKIIGEVNIQKIKIPSAIIQPLIENAIRYGLLHKTNGIKKISIQFLQDDMLKCIITDNGIGIKASKNIQLLNNNTQSSFSTKSLQDRLDLLREYFKLDIDFKYESLDKGVRVTLNIPYRTNDK